MGDLGLYFSSIVWNTFVMSTLTFVAQLEAPPPKVDEVIHRLLRRAAHGPGNWFEPRDVMNLRGAFGFAGEFRGIEPMATATRFRVAHSDSRSTGGLHIRRRAATLYRNIRHSTEVVRSGVWADWYRNSALLQLDDTIINLRDKYDITAKTPSRRAPHARGRRCCATRSPATSGAQ